MSDVPLDAPSPCPGTQSDLAGKASACEGCPNQSLCSSGQARLSLSQREPDTILSIKRRLGSIRHRIIILSGKGGVGKSSLSVCLARGLSRRERSQMNGCNETYRIGLLDLDFCGPSIPCMFGCMDEKVSFQVHQSQSGWSPVFVTENLCLMSMGFLLPSPDHPVIWRGPRKNTLIRQFLTDVAWTEEDSNLDQGTNLDFLIIDTPPGTSDEHLSVVQYLQAAECLDGAIIITTPQEVSLCDVRKEIDFCRKLSIPVLGVVENMVEFVCPTCKHICPLFPSFTGGARSLSAMKHNENADDPSFPDLEIIGRLPLDPRLTRALDEGLCPFELAESNSFISQHSKNPDGGLQSSDTVIVSFQELFNNLLERLRK